MTTSVKLDDDLKKRIQYLARSRKRTTQWIMREAIHEYVEREEARESFKQEAVASWQAFQETKRHLTWSELNDWLATWGSDKETGIPPCCQ